jgi:hypothetical protein
MNAYDMALLAGKVYDDTPTIGDASSASRMCVYPVAGGTVHALRGTDNIMSAITDGDMDTVEVYGLGHLHSGFWEAMAAMLPRMLALPHPTAITGHSLGAAMAIIYGAALALQGVVVPVYAFEPPRLCGDDVMRQLLLQAKVPVLATRNGNDLVTQVPPQLSLPVDLTDIGRAAYVWPNITDHEIANVQVAVKEAGL